MMKTTNIRPRLNVTPTPTDIVVEITALVGLASLFIITAVYWPHIPAKVPTHIGGSGKVDAWGPKDTLWIMPALGAVTYLVFTVIQKFPHTFNYPVPITAENAEREYRVGISAMRWLKMECILMFGYLHSQTIKIAMGQAKELGTAFMPVMLAVVVVTSVILIVQAYRAK